MHAVYSKKKAIVAKGSSPQVIEIENVAVWADKKSQVLPKSGKSASKTFHD
jgi:hypothetical protein